MTTLDLRFRRLIHPFAFTILLVAAACGKPAGGAAAPGTPGQPANAAQAAPAPPARAPEELLRTELATWKGAKYADGGTDKDGIGNAAFVEAVMHGAFDIEIPVTYDEQFHTGRLVERDALAPGDLVFFEGQGFGPFKSHFVGIFLDAKTQDVAIATKDLGVSTIRLSESRWSGMFKTARRISRDPADTAPTFDVAKYGSNRAALLHDIASAWSGVLYKQGGTTFEGIGNDEFVREVYGAIYETDLEGTPANWAKMGQAVPRDKLEPGDIILYQAEGLGALVNQHHAGIYIGGGEFVHAVKGSAVTISKMDDPRWSSAFRDARRIDPDALERTEQAEAEAPKESAEKEKAAPSAKGTAAARSGGTPEAEAEAEPAEAEAQPAPGPMSDDERRLRAVEADWRGTPYKIGGTTKTGVDCSAFVRAVYQAVYKVDLPRTAAEQEELGSVVDRQHLQPGDLVFFRTQGMGPMFQSRHVGIYVGDGEFAQASGRHGVTISRLDDYYWKKKFHSARRLPHS